MTREILFRGKRIGIGDWVEGGIIRGNFTWIITTDEFGKFKHYMVDPSTVGQYTGLTDKNGKRIFEGDVVRISWHAPRRDTVYEVYEVVYGKSGFYMQKYSRLQGQVSSYVTPNVNLRCEVIGNIHDNPELLKEEPV